MSRIMGIQMLPSNILANILSMTDDNTIYSLAASCKAMHTVLKEQQHEITWAKYHYSDYAFFADMPFNGIHSNETTLIPKIESIWTETHELSMYLFTLMLLHKVDGRDDYDIISSIKVRGDVNLITLTIGQHVNMSLNISEYLKNNILTEDTNGYIEVLKPFMEYIPTHCLNAMHAFMSLQSYGDDVTINITKAKLKDKPSKCPLQYRTPFTFFSRRLEEVSNELVIPVSCTWSKDIACISFNKEVKGALQRIELTDTKSNTIFKISAVRLEVSFLQKLSKKYNWLNCTQPHTRYIVPLFGYGGLYSIKLSFNTTIVDLQVSGVRWQETCVVFPMPSLE